MTTGLYLFCMGVFSQLDQFTTARLLTPCRYVRTRAQYLYGSFFEVDQPPLPLPPWLPKMKRPRVLKAPLFPFPMAKQLQPRVQVASTQRIEGRRHHSRRLEVFQVLAEWLYTCQSMTPLKEHRRWKEGSTFQGYVYSTQKSTVG